MDNPSDPLRVSLGLGLGARGGRADSYSTEIMCYINSGIINSGDFKNDLHFPYTIPSSPGAGGGAA